MFELLAEGVVKECMLGPDQSDLLWLVHVEDSIPKSHPLRVVERLVDQVLTRLQQ